MSKTQVVKNTNSYYLADRTRFVNEDDKNLALSMDDITDIVQSLTGLTQYLPFLSIFPEVHYLTLLLVHISWNLT